MTLRNSNDREGQEGSSHIRKIKTAASEDNKIQLARMRKEMAEKERQTRLLEAIRLKEERWRNNYNANTNHKTNSNHVLVGGISGRSSIRRDEDERRAAVRERKRQQDEEHRKRMEALKAKQDAKLAMLNQTQSSPKRQSKPSRSLNDANSKPINKQLKEELNKKPTNRPQKPLPARLQQTIDRLAVPKRRNFASLPIRNNLSSQAHSQSMHPLTSNPKSQMTLTTVFHRGGTTKRKTSGVVVGNVAMQSKPSPPQPATPRQSGENSPLLTKAQSTYSYSSVTDNDDDDEEQQRRIHQEYQEAEKKRLQEAIAERERIEQEEIERKRLEDERKAENERLRICAEEERKARLAKDEIEREERRQKLNAILESAQSKLNYMDDDDHHHRNHHSSSAASSGIASEDNSFHNNDDDNDASTDSILERIIGNSLKTLGSPTDSIFAIRRVPSPINTTSSSLTTSEQPNNSNAAVNGNNENERSQSSSPPSTPPVTQTSPSSAIPNSNGGDSLKLLS